MSNFKSVLLSFFVLGILTVLGYWAFSTIQNGSSYVDSEQIKTLKNENEALSDRVKELENNIEGLNGKLENNEDNKVPEVASEEPVEPVKTETPTQVKTLKYQSMIDEIQKIINAGVIMKKGSQGTRVGTIQKFLNIYNKTSTKVDNDFGANMETAVKKFQSSVGLKADGGVGATTMRKMIEWLKKQ